MTLKTPEQWLQEDEFSHIKILDPDGWRGKGAPAWDAPIDRNEFQQRLVKCTVDMSEWLKKQPPPLSEKEMEDIVIGAITAVRLERQQETGD